MNGITWKGWKKESKNYQALWDDDGISWNGIKKEMNGVSWNEHFFQKLHAV